MRQALLATALVLTLALAGGLALQPEPASELVQVLPARAQPADRPAAGPWAAPSPQALAAWAAPEPASVPEPAPEVAADAPPAPEPPVPVGVEAPPPPGRWIGRLDDATGRAALIEGPAAARLVREQEVLDGQWRLERIADDRLQWRWLPGDLLREQART